MYWFDDEYDERTNELLLYFYYKYYRKMFFWVDDRGIYGALVIYEEILSFFIFYDD